MSKNIYMFAILKKKISLNNVKTFIAWNTWFSVKNIWALEVIFK